MIEGVIIFAMSVTRTRSSISTIRVCGTRNRTEPTVEQDEILSHGCKIANLVLRVEVHHFSKACHVRCFVCNGLISNEAVQFQLSSVREVTINIPAHDFELLCWRRVYLLLIRCEGIEN